ncbi:hypothetical protein MHU86_187 [Fragilaria crotonensis]|nr:hypothetical protein MHU86_187 [Fragilaria crotonensis]
MIGLDEGPLPFTGMEDFQQHGPAPQRRFQRRSSCSALPSTTTMELNDVAVREPREGVPLGSFLRFNNSFSDSVTSISDNSECAMSGDNSGLAVQNTECAKFDVGAFSEMTGIEFCPDGLGGDAEGAAPEKKKKKKKKQSKESDGAGEKPSRRRMQRRSSWCASTTTQEPMTAVDGVVVRERRHRSSRKLVAESSPLPEPENDGVITSFKSTNCYQVMFEERSTSTTSDRCLVVASEEKNDVNEDHVARNAVPNSEIPAADSSESPRPRGRVNRRASWSGGGCNEQPSNQVDMNSTDVVQEDGRRTSSPNHSTSVHDLGRKDVVRTLLMVKHVQSGAAKARRRVSWTASTVNCLDEPPRSPVDNPHDLVADVFSYLKKTAHDDVEDQDSVTENPDNVSPVPEVATTTVVQEDDSTTGSSSRRMERRSSWHASSSSQPQSSVNSNTSQRSSQTFVLDLSDPSKNWTCNEEFLDANDGQEGSQTQQQQQQLLQSGRKTSTRPWKLGKSRNQPDGVGAPDFLVVSSANMPVHDWRAETYDASSSCLQLTAFGDVTTIGCE